MTDNDLAGTKPIYEEWVMDDDHRGICPSVTIDMTGRFWDEYRRECMKHLLPKIFEVKEIKGRHSIEQSVEDAMLIIDAAIKNLQKKQ